jgi:serine/threonine protein kinase
MFECFSGLAYMHSKGFVHRDLKPDNILVVNGVAKLADLGISKELRK